MSVYDMFDPWFSENLVCPVSSEKLEYEDGALKSPSGRIYPVVDGIPVMLVGEQQQTMDLAHKSLARAMGDQCVIDQRAPELFLESLGISDEEKDYLVANLGKFNIDPVVSMIIGATSGYAYTNQIGNLSLNEYPIPEIPIPKSAEKEMLLDVGCNWGRWSIAASRRGYDVVGIDPSLGAVMSAKRVAKNQNQKIRFVVGDARFLPFRAELFDTVFSYSVLQHFSKEDAIKAIREAKRVMKKEARVKIQLANAYGVRSLQHQANRGFREAKDFEVTYWTPKEIKQSFTNIYGNAEIETDCFLGLGWQRSDWRFMSRKKKLILACAEMLKSCSKIMPPFRYLADSIYVISTKK